MKKRILHKCPSCGCAECYPHELYCELERCPFCGRQLFSCECAVELCWSPGKTEDQCHHEFEGLLSQIGRVPYIEYPNICAKCGEIYPDMFKVSDEEWAFYIQKNMRDRILFRSCFDSIKEMVDYAIAKSKHSPNR